MSAIWRGGSRKSLPIELRAPAQRQQVSRPQCAPTCLRSRHPHCAAKLLSAPSALLMSLACRTRIRWGTAFGSEKNFSGCTPPIRYKERHYCNAGLGNKKNCCPPVIWRPFLANKRHQVWRPALQLVRCNADVAKVQHQSPLYPAPKRNPMARMRWRKKSLWLMNHTVWQRCFCPGWHRP